MDVKKNKGLLLNNTSVLSLYLTIGIDQLPRFIPLLISGFMVKVRVGCTIREMLREKLGLTQEYIEDRIQTIFLDGKPIDDIDSAILENGSTLALSAAVPGLAGTIFRKGGYLASLRSLLTDAKEKKHDIDRERFIALRLFNLLIRDLGLELLQQGIWIEGEELKEFLKSLPCSFWMMKCKEIRINGEKCHPDKIKNVKWADNKVFLQISTQYEET